MKILQEDREEKEREKWEVVVLFWWFSPAPNPGYLIFYVYSNIWCI